MIVLYGTKTFPLDSFKFYQPNFFQTVTTGNVSEILIIQPSICGGDDGALSITSLNPNTTYQLTYTYDSQIQSINMVSDFNGEIIVYGFTSGVISDITINNILTGITEAHGSMEFIYPPLTPLTIVIDQSTCGASDGIIRFGNLNPGSDYNISFNYKGTIFKSVKTANTDGFVEFVSLPPGDYVNFEILDPRSNCYANFELIEVTEVSFSVSFDLINPKECEGNDGGIILRNLNMMSSYSISYEYQGETYNLLSLVDSRGRITIAELNPGIYSNFEIIDNVTGCLDILGMLELKCLDDDFMCFQARSFFSPNNDGQNDAWGIERIGSFCDYVIFIFNRYGKLLKTLTPSDDKWDGYFNGKPLPQDDYWYQVNYNNGIKDLVYRSHFTLKR